MNLTSSLGKGIQHSALSRRRNTQLQQLNIIQNLFTLNYAVFCFNLTPSAPPCCLQPLIIKYFCSGARSEYYPSLNCLLIYKKLQASEEDYTDDYNERKALITWATLCGASPMDEPIFNFILGEISLIASSALGCMIGRVCVLKHKFSTESDRLKGSISTARFLTLQES